MHAGVLVNPSNDFDMKKLNRLDTPNTVQTQTSRRIFSFPASIRAQTRTFENRPMTPTERDLPLRIFENPSGKKQPMPPGWKGNDPATPDSPSVQRDKYGQQIFSFEDLQNIQHLKEKANEALLVLRLNLNVIMQLKQHYVCITKCKELPDKLSGNCKWEMISFERRIDGITKNLELQILRVESLLCSLTDRKTLVGSQISLLLSLAKSVTALRSPRLPEYPRQQGTGVSVSEVNSRDEAHDT